MSIDLHTFRSPQVELHCIFPLFCLTFPNINKQRAKTYQHKLFCQKANKQQQPLIQKQTDKRVKCSRDAAVLVRVLTSYQCGPGATIQD